MNFTEELAIKAEKCSNELYKCFENLANDHTNIYDAFKYSIKLPGKRLRMIILLESSKLFSRNIDDSIPFACALEMIHTYSLIHDDLPAMDNAMYRRGQLTNHLRFGESTAILAGDGLLNYAFEVMTESSLKNPSKTLNYMKAINEIAKSSGTDGIILGQALDTQLASQNKNIELLQLIYDKKTAALFTGAMKAGAIIAGASDAEVSSVGEFAYHFGIAFQITDDILDITGNPDLTGKSSGNDASNDKITIASLLGVTDSLALAKKHIENSKKHIHPFDRFGFFENLCNFILDRKT